MGLLDKLFGRDDLNLREARFDGMLYPADEDELRDEVRALLTEARQSPQAKQAALAGAKPLRALIVPQAEYAFAGPVMAAGWAPLREQASQIERVVLVGSSRLVPFRGLAITGYDGFQTPMGPVVFDKQALEALARLEQVRVIEPAFDPESSLEAQLPFVCEVLGQVALVPIMVGDATDEQVEDALAGFIDDPKTLIVVSANLSDDQTFERAEALDEDTERAIEALDAEQISREHSNGRIAIRGLLRAASAHGLVSHTIVRRSSADTAGSETGPVTGYGAYAFGAPT
jgi:AmmeMemoRadiSam system protein B